MRLNGLTNDNQHAKKIVKNTLSSGYFNKPEDKGNIKIMFSTLLYNIMGWPAIVVRCGTASDGLPIGVQIIANAWRDDIALAVAKALEEIAGGWQAPAI